MALGGGADQLNVTILSINVVLNSNIVTNYYII